MAGADRHQTHENKHFTGVPGLVIGLSMTVRRGPVCRLVADLAGLVPGDRVLDVGCGPGSAVREAARRGATVTGVDPAGLMLRLGGSLSVGPRRRDVTFLAGTAEALPLPTASVTVAWAISSAHHWSDTEAGLREIYRVLEPAGRLVIAERLARPGARGLAAHGFTPARAAEIVAAARSAGFGEARWETHRAGRRNIAVVLASRPG